MCFLVLNETGLLIFPPGSLYTREAAFKVPMMPTLPRMALFGVKVHGKAGESSLLLHFLGKVFRLIGRSSSGLSILVALEKLG